MAPDEERDAQDDEPDDDVVEAAELVSQVLPVLAQDHAPVGPRPAGQRLDDASRYAPARERKDQLGRDGNSGTFDGHGDDDADVPETTVQRVDEGQDELVDGLDQVSVS